MSKNKVTRSINVDGVDYLYRISLANRLLIIFENRVIRRQINLDDYTIETVTWRGKKYHGPYGKREVASIIRQYKKNTKN